MIRSSSVLVLAALVACGSPAPEAPAIATPAATARDPVFGQIPHDSPYVYVPSGDAPAGMSPRQAITMMREQLGPALAAISDEEVAAMEPHERLGYAAMHMIAELDDATLIRIGVGDYSNRTAIYGWGLVPVMRFELDGKLLRELFAEAARKADVAAPFEEWKGRPFVRWRLEEREIVVVFLERQVAAAFARRAEDVLPHLVGDAPPERVFDPAAAARRAGLDGELTVMLDPQRAAALLADGGPGGWRSISDAGAACGVALGKLAAAFPLIVGAKSGAGDKTVHLRVGPSALARRVAGSVRPLPHWPAGRTPIGSSRVAMGVSPQLLIESLTDVLEVMEASRIGCGLTPSTDTFPAQLKSLSLPLGTIRAFTATFHSRDEHDPMPLQLELVAEVSDPMALYQWVASVLGLSSKPPPLDQPTPINLGFLPMSLTLHRDGISATAGRHDAAALASLKASPPGPALFMRTNYRGDPAAGDERDFDLSIRADGDYLWLDYTSGP